MQVKKTPEKYGFINVLNDNDVNKTIHAIENLYDYWVQRHNIDSYILGAALYEHQKDYGGIINYFNIAKIMNPILLENFGWLYEILLEKLSIELAEPFEITDIIGYPGFHIFGHPHGKLNSDVSIQMMQTLLANIHSDIQGNLLVDYWKETFQSDFDLSNPMSFTLALELPKNGAGLSTWGINDYEKNDDYEKYLKSLDYKKFPYEYLGPPDIVPYTVGNMFYFFGDMLHQIAPAYKMDYNDRRITMQGHAIKCKGIWRVYF